MPFCQLLPAHWLTIFLAPHCGLSAGLYVSNRTFESIWANEGCLPALGVNCLFHILRALHIISISVDSQTKSVEVITLFTRTRAQWVNEHHGCVLRQPGQVRHACLQELPRCTGVVCSVPKTPLVTLQCCHVLKLDITSNCRQHHIM